MTMGQVCNLYSRMTLPNQREYINKLIAALSEVYPHVSPRQWGKLKARVANNPNSIGALKQVIDDIKYSPDSADSVGEAHKIIAVMGKVVQDYYYPHCMIDEDAQEFTTLDYDSQVEITKALMVKTLDDNATIKERVNMGECLHISRMNPDRASVFRDLSTGWGTQEVLRAARKARNDQHQLEFAPLMYHNRVVA